MRLAKPPMFFCLRKRRVFGELSARVLHTVCWMEQQADFRRITRGVITYDFAGRIRRAILADYDFIVETCFLHQCAFNRLTNVALLIVGEHEDAYPRLRHTV